MAADRITRVSLVANVSNYVTGMNQAAAATRATGTAAEQLAQRREGIETLGKALLAVGAVAAAGVALAVTKFAEFDAAVSGIQAATHATTQDMNSLRDAAVKAGADTVFSATEAANAITELAKAGVSTKDILGGGLNGALSLASAGELDVADAAQIAATAMTQFGIAGSEVPHVADLLAAGAGKAQGSVQDLSQALNQGGLVASQAGQSIDDTTGVLAAFASQGLLGSDAGTSLKTALLALENPSTKAAGVMKEYGINVYDAQGNMNTFQQIAGTLETQLGGLTDEQRNAALATIFGNDAVRAANVLYSEGASGIGDWTAKVNDNGYAAETARLKLDNLRGDLERLGGSFDTALIQSGSSANGVLRTLVTAAGGLVDAFGSAPKPLIASGLALGTLVAIIGLVGGAALLAVPKFVAFKAALSQVGVAGRTAAIGMGVLSVGLTAATLAIGYFVSQQAKVSANTEQLVSTLDSATGALTKYSRAFVAKQLADSGSFEAAKKAGVGQKELTDAVIKGGDALDDVKSKLDAKNTLGSFFTGEGIKASKAKDEIVGLNKSVGDSQDAFKDQKKAGVDVADANGQIADTASDASDSVNGLGDSASDSADALEDLKNTIDGLGSTTLDLRSAQRDMQAAIDDVTASVKDNGRTLDIGTEKGRSNQAALDGIAQKAKAVASATLEQTGSQEKASAAIARGRQALIEALGQFGITGAAAKAYADRLGLIPSDVKTSVQLQTAGAQAELNRFLATNDGRIINTYTKNNVSTITTGSKMTATTGAPRNATGGPIIGPGTGTSDDILSYLSNGEHVFTADEVKKLGGQGAVERLRAQIRAGLIPKFATGGPIRLTGASSSDRTSFRTSVRSGDYDGLNAVADLYRMAQDASAYSAGARAKYAAVANQQEQALLKLQSRSEKAASKVETLSSKVDDLKDSSASMASSVASSVSKFEVGDYGSAAGLKAGLSRSVGSATEFASLLKKLAKKGIAGPMLAEIASLGTADGLPLARSLDLATAGDISSINASYKALGTIGAGAGKTVADANFGKLIAAAEKQLKSADRNADKITRAINRRGDELRKLVGRALGVKGYSAGGFTGSGAKFDVAGVVHAGEYVVNAAATANPRNRMMLESMNRDGFPGYASGGYANPVYVRGTGAGMDVSAVVAAIRSMPARQVIQNNDIKPIQNGDPQVITTTLGRELSRQMAGMV